MRAELIVKVAIRWITSPPVVLGKYFIDYLIHERGWLAASCLDQKNREIETAKNTDFISSERNEKQNDPHLCSEKEKEKPVLSEMKNKKKEKHATGIRRWIG